MPLSRACTKPPRSTPATSCSSTAPPRASAPSARSARTADPSWSWVENSGEFTISLHAVTSVHDGKVMVDARKLDQPLRAAIGHAHDHEA